MKKMKPSLAREIKAALRRRDMRKLLTKGLSKAAIARQYGISRQRVDQILKGAT